LSSDQEERTGAAVVPGSEGSGSGHTSPPGSARSRRRAPRGSAGMMPALGTAGVAQIATTDVGAHRERARSTRLQRVAMVLAPVAALLILRDVFDPGASRSEEHTSELQ